jgi:hypothetical protein
MAKAKATADVQTSVPPSMLPWWSCRAEGLPRMDVVAADEHAARAIYRERLRLARADLAVDVARI